MILKKIVFFICAQSSSLPRSCSLKSDTYRRDWPSPSHILTLEILSGPSSEIFKNYLFTSPLEREAKQMIYFFYLEVKTLWGLCLVQGAICIWVQKKKYSLKPSPFCVHQMLPIILLESSEIHKDEEKVPYCHLQIWVFHFFLVQKSLSFLTPHPRPYQRLGKYNIILGSQNAWQDRECEKCSRRAN